MRLEYLLSGVNDLVLVYIYGLLLCIEVLQGILLSLSFSFIFLLTFKMCEQEISFIFDAVVLFNIYDISKQAMACLEQ